jgi:hypothetical protein
MLVPVTKLSQLTKCHFLLANYPSLGIMVLYRLQTTEDRRQRTAGQIVNLSNSQKVMNGLKEELSIWLISHLTNRPFDELTNSLIF